VKIYQTNGELLFWDEAYTTYEEVLKITKDLRNANLRNADLRNANLENANFRDANLRNANLWNADLRNANLEDADLRNANLSGVKIFNTKKWLYENFKKVKKGIIVYKIFGLHYKKSDWVIKKNSYITEIVNHTKTQECGCGVNVATKEWIKDHREGRSIIWKCLIEWEDLIDVCVPYNTDGKIRAGRIKLLEEVEI
jgi:hypothetical protein